MNQIHSTKMYKIQSSFDGSLILCQSWDVGIPPQLSIHWLVCQQNNFAQVMLGSAGWDWELGWRVGFSFCSTCFKRWTDRERMKSAM